MIQQYKQCHIFMTRNIISEMLNQRTSQAILRNMNKVPSLLKTNKYNLTEISDELQFTPAFYETIRQKLNKKPEGYFLRLEIFAGEGCEGFTYKFKFDDQLNSQQDYVKTILEIENEKQTGKPVKTNRVLFAVNGEQIKLLRGATIDFAQEMMREVFYVKENPNAEIQCSCKTSFSPKEGLL